MHCCCIQTEVFISGNKRTCIKTEAQNNTPLREKENDKQEVSSGQRR
jgi:hypothetical protein